MNTIIDGHATLVSQTCERGGSILYYGHYTDNRGSVHYGGIWGTDSGDVMDRTVAAFPHRAPYEVLLYVYVRESL